MRLTKGQPVVVMVATPLPSIKRIQNRDPVVNKRNVSAWSTSCVGAKQPGRSSCPEAGQLSSVSDQECSHHQRQHSNSRQE